MKAMAFYQFRFLQLIICAEIKQKTTRVDSDPRGSSDPEAVSGSSTIVFKPKAANAAFFLPRSISK